MRAIALLLVLLALPAASFAAGHGAHRPDTCPDAALSCATNATPFFARDGRMWLAWATSARVAVAWSRDLGRTFSAPVFITPDAARMDGGADSRAQIVVDAQGRVIVAYAVVRGAAYSGQVLFSVSTDGGATFSAPRALTDDPASQRFQMLTLDPGGDAFAAWIDKRELAAAQAAGRDYAGAALAFAWFGGTEPAPARIAIGNTCECCRLAVAFAAPHRPAVLWRHIFAGGVRDHAVMTFQDAATAGPIARVSTDDWQIDACPHHGPSLAISAQGTYHAAWFTDGTARQGLFYARSSDGGQTFNAPTALGDADRLPSRPQVLSQAETTWLAWKEFDGERTSVVGMMSRDDGLTWSPPRPIASTADASDHPLLVSDGRASYLSWLTKQEGYRLIPLESAP